LVVPSGRAALLIFLSFVASSAAFSAPGAFRVGSSAAPRLRSLASATPRVKAARVASGLAMVSISDWFKENGHEISTFDNMGGSGWASMFHYKTADGPGFFVKTAGQPADKMFKGEALGLQAMYHAGAVRIPKVYGCEDDGKGGSYIIMEYLSLGGTKDQKEFGRAMAQMHLAEPLHDEAKAGKFGFPVPNTIGGTPQPNVWDDNWVRFFREQRIGHQVKLAGDGQLDRLWASVCDKTDGLNSLFTGITVKPSILHGDLWSGNVAGSGGKPTIFDPASYYGHHEAEWGMSWCASFGGQFWEGYRELIPKDEGFETRAVLYELYHKLNHHNLFGGGYLSDSVRLMDRLNK